MLTLAEQLVKVCMLGILSFERRFSTAPSHKGTQQLQLFGTVCTNGLEIVDTSTLRNHPTHQIADLGWPQGMNAI